MADASIPILDSEPLKLVFNANKLGYSGDSLADYLRDNGIEVEFSDRELVVLMATPDNSEADYLRLESAMQSLSKKPPIKKEGGAKIYASRPRRVMSVRDAVLSECEIISCADAVGRIAATPSVSCPPAIPIVVSGELITRDAVDLFIEYGIEKIEVVKQ